LIKDRDALLAFYDFPAEHWKTSSTCTANRSRAVRMGLRYSTPCIGAELSERRCLYAFDLLELDGEDLRPSLRATARSG
jgi:hypothetical protein